MMQTFFTPRHTLLLLFHHRRLLIVAVILMALIALVMSLLQPAVYRASAVMLIDDTVFDDNVAETNGADYQAVLSNERRTITYSNLLLTNQLLDGTIQQLGLSLKPAQLRRMIRVNTVGTNTQLIRVDVRGQDPTLIAQIADTLVTLFSNQRQGLQNERFAASERNLLEQISLVEQDIQHTDERIAALATDDQATRVSLEEDLTRLRQSYANLLRSYEEVRLTRTRVAPQAALANPADVPSTPIAPNAPLNTALGSLLGFLLGCGVVLFRASLDDTVTRPDILSQQLELPILGMITHTQNMDAAQAVIMQPRSPVAEAFRNLRTNINFAGVGRDLKTLAITSPSPGEGKSTISINLAYVMAQIGKRVILADVDLRRPTLHKKFDTPNRFGVTDLFVQPAPAMADVVQATAVPGLSLLTSGELPPNPSELLGSERMEQIIVETHQHADLLLLDTPPVLAATDAVVLCEHVDGVVLVVRAGQTKLSACRQAVEQLRFINAPLLGLVINDVSIRSLTYTYQNQAYGSNDGSGIGSLRARWPWKKAAKQKTSAF